MRREYRNLINYIFHLILLSFIIVVFLLGIAQPNTTLIILSLMLFLVTASLPWNCAYRNAEIPAEYDITRRKSDERH